MNYFGGEEEGPHPATAAEGEEAWVAMGTSNLTLQIKSSLLMRRAHSDPFSPRVVRTSWP